jgi:anaerobic ribonucleoside-triphosphate reductase
MRCHDCSKELVNGEEYMPYRVGEREFAKCRNCHEAEPLLRDFQEAEVYSRVVGYIRPVKQWNKGKQAEYGDRKEYAPTGAVVEGCVC